MRAQPFNLIRRIAVGGEADVWLAEGDVCVKIMRPQTARVDDFLNGARMLERLDHPNIVKVYDYGRCEDEYFIILEYIDGVNLEQLRIQHDQQGKWCPLPLALSIVSSVCDALQHAHDRNAIHGDVTTRNIMIAHDGSVKLIDFLSTDSQVDRHTDLHALGVILYELVTGTSLTRMQRHISPPSRVNPHIEKSVDDLVMKAIEPNPRHRYQSAHEMKTALILSK